MPDLSASGSRRRTSGRAALYAIPLLLVALLSATYFAAPSFYLDHVLKEESRETQIVEIITFTCASLGGIAAIIIGLRLFFLQRGGLIRGRGGACIIGVIGLAAVFFAGEEVSWGQTWFGWETPAEYREHSIETNLHNTDIPVQTLGSLFLITMFFVLPLAWRFRHKLRLPDSWSPGIAEGPVIFCMAVAFAWREIKTIYRLYNPDASDTEPGLYADFIEQFNEIKEMLVAVTILMYACYRIRALRRWIAERPTEDAR